MNDEPIIAGDLAEIEAAVGREAVLVIAREFAGRFLIIPGGDARDGPLPALLEEIADVIGRPGAVAIADAFGGTRIYFPSSDRAPLHGPLCQVIGKAAVRKLAHQFGNLVFSIPKFHSSVIAANRLKVAELLAQGQSIGTVAKQVGVSERTIHNHKARLKRNGYAFPPPSNGGLVSQARALLATGKSVSEVVAATGLRVEIVRGQVRSLIRRRGLPRGSTAHRKQDPT